ncbi:MAG: hypothetical protein R3E39_23210 [Anaerolineae bacterium]
MRQLTIQYVHEGHKRGYNYTSPTNGFNDDTLKTVWRTAMPRGQGWGAAIYNGAESLKTFPLPDGRIALAQVTVTGERDEDGRGGIRRAVVDIMQPGEYLDALRARLMRYPTLIQSVVNREHGFGRRRIPRVRGEKQVLLSHPYADANRWQLVEATILVEAVEHLERRWLSGKYFSFTTLALDYREESQVVVLPELRAQELKVDSFNLLP